MLDTLHRLLAYDPARPMLFTGVGFWLFMLVVLAGVAAFARRESWRNAWLAAVSFYFYYRCSGWHVLLLLVSTLANFALGNAIYNARTPRSRDAALVAAVAGNLGVLAYYKYAYLLVDFVNALFGTQLQVVDWFAALGDLAAGGVFDASSILLPVGVSFFTFQCVSYTVDIYRYQVAPARSVVDFAFYVAFFPQLVAGPIVRAAEFVPQLYRRYRVRAFEFGLALFWIANGLCKKILISDYISVNFVDRVFDAPLVYSGFANLMAVYGYAIQIYCDFSGYTDIAIGVALLLGFRLPLNFRSPYKAASVSEFWRRWHISLSRWLRDYLYIPLGGNRLGRFRTGVNLMLTMLLGGLWHGASPRFLLWGGIHGLALILDKLRTRLWPSTSRWPAFWGGFVTFHVVCFAWIFFRAADMGTVAAMLGQIAGGFGWDEAPQVIVGYAKPLALIALAFLIHWLPERWKRAYRKFFIALPVYQKVLLFAVLALVLYQCQSAGIQPFIYFQF